MKSSFCSELYSEDFTEYIARLNALYVSQFINPGITVAVTSLSMVAPI